MKNLNVLLGMLFICFLLSACDNDDDLITCEQEVIISAEEYNDSTIFQPTINSLEINENCLNINYTATGCGEESWDLKLIDSEGIDDSLPPQRSLKLSLIYFEETICTVEITAEQSFDISELQVNTDAVWLNFVISGDQILYEY